MAKKPPTTFETKETPQYTKEGVNLKSLLQFATGKGENEEVTQDDFNRLLSNSGVTGRDARRLNKAFQTINTSNSDYILSTNGQGFNVFDKTTGQAKSNSSKKAGNTQGTNLSDLVRLGSNVSQLAGFASRSIPAYLKPKAEVTSKAEAPPSSNTPLNQVAPPPAEQQATKVAPKSTVKPSTKKPLDNMLEDPTMRGFLLNGTKGATGGVQFDENGLPKVELPSVPKAVAEEITKVNAEAEAKRKQKEYSSYLRNRYSNLFDYLTNKNFKLDVGTRSRLYFDVDKLRRTAPDLHNYLKQFHSDQLKRLGYGND